MKLTKIVTVTVRFNVMLEGEDNILMVSELLSGAMERVLLDYRIGDTIVVPIKNCIHTKELNPRAWGKVVI